MPSDTTGGDADGADFSNPQIRGEGEGDEDAGLAVPIHFVLQYIKDLSYENPRAPQIYQDFDEPDVNINVNVQADDLAPRAFEVSLKLSVSAKNGNDTAFLAELDYAGIANVDESVPEENVRPLVLIEGPRLLFPFARSILANLTRDSAFPLLLLGPIDFVKMYSDSVQAQQGGAPAEA